MSRTKGSFYSRNVLNTDLNNLSQHLPEYEDFNKLDANLMRGTSEP
jgi:hypothetical protein